MHGFERYAAPSTAAEPDLVRRNRFALVEDTVRALKSLRDEPLDMRSSRERFAALADLMRLVSE